jgi:hypothetical protein
MESVFSSEEFQNIMENNLKEVVKFLFKNGIEFEILVDLSFTKFDPALPKSITSYWEDIELFGIVQYSFETAKLKNSILTFRAGFSDSESGVEFESTISVPLLAIEAIFKAQEPVLINLAVPREESKSGVNINIEDAEIEDSFQTLLNNPKNRGILKKIGKD